MMLRRVIFFVRLLLPFLLYLLLGEQTTSTWAFTLKTTTTTTSITSHQSQSQLFRTPTSGSVIVLNAGGFEWEDPTDEANDQGVDNPFKNPELLNKIEEGSSDDDKKTIDPARLLGARLQGSNLYLIGMMGSGKSSVGDKLARRK
jgi:shikimate kinase